MNSKLEKKRSLRELLDRMVVAQKEDIYAFTSGHLNETKMFKPTPQVPSSPRPLVWATSRRSRPLSKQTTFSPDSMDSAVMQNALVSFVVGGGVAKQNPKLTRLEPIDSSQAQCDLKSLENQSRTMPEDSFTSAGRTPRLAVINERLNPLLGENLQTAPRHLESLTKTEEYSKLKAYEREILQKPILLERNIYARRKTVEHLENQLKTRIDELDCLGCEPGIHRLEAHSNVFDQLISSSPIFGAMLETIKKEYDDYLSYLLDGQVHKHEILQDQLKQLADMRTTNSAAISSQAQTLIEVEQRAKHALEENEQLRSELRKEMELASQPQPEICKQKKQLAVPREERVDLAERILLLNDAVCNKMEAIKSLQAKIRKECVPTTVCTYLRHCIKENDVEIQRLMSQKEYYERSISELDKDLHEAIETADTTERDAKKFWRKLESQLRKTTGPLSGELGNSSNTSVKMGEEEKKLKETEDEEDESYKWNWYIS